MDSLTSVCAELDVFAKGYGGSNTMASMLENVDGSVLKSERNGEA